MVGLAADGRVEQQALPDGAPPPQQPAFELLYDQFETFQSERSKILFTSPRESSSVIKDLSTCFTCARLLILWISGLWTEEPRLQIVHSSPVTDIPERHQLDASCLLYDTFLGLAITIHIWCMYGFLGKESTEYTVIYEVFAYGSGQPYAFRNDYLSMHRDNHTARHC